MPENLQTTRTPTLAEVIRNALSAELREVYVSLPAVVTAYDPTTQLAQVHPLLKRPFVNPDGSTTVESRPVISNVPVIFPSGGGFRIIFPLEVGDVVDLLMSDQSLDRWKALGGEVDPVDLASHAMKDCVAIPGLHPKQNPWTVVNSGNAYFGQDGGPEIEVTPTGINLGSGATLSVARATDPIQITAAQILAAGLTSPSGPVTLTDPIQGTILSGSTLVKAK